MPPTYPHLRNCLPLPPLLTGLLSFTMAGTQQSLCLAEGLGHGWLLVTAS